MGAANDPDAPYNQKDVENMEIEETVKLNVTLDGGEVCIYFGDIDVTYEFKEQFKNKYFKSIESDFWSRQSRSRRQDLDL